MSRRVGFGNEGPDGRDEDGTKPDPRTRIIPSVFLTIWLIAWGGGIFFVVSLLVGEAGAESGAASFAMVIWLILAIAGFLLGLRALTRILRGGTPFKGRRNTRPVDADGALRQPAGRAPYSDGGHGGDGGDGSD